MCVEDGGHSYRSMASRTVPASVMGSSGSPVTNSSMVLLTMLYFSSLVALSSKTSSERRCSMSGRLEEWM